MSKTSSTWAMHVLAMGGMRDYHERVVNHYNNLLNIGSFDKNDFAVDVGLLDALACGNVMKM